jgi:hypothetical protein
MASSRPEHVDAAIRGRCRTTVQSLMCINFDRAIVGYAASRNQGPSVLATVWENGDVQENSGSYSLGASGQAGD